MPSGRKRPNPTAGGWVANAGGPAFHPGTAPPGGGGGGHPEAGGGGHPEDGGHPGAGGHPGGRGHTGGGGQAVGGGGGGPSAGRSVSPLSMRVIVHPVQATRTRHGGGAGTAVLAR